MEKFKCMVLDKSSCFLCIPPLKTRGSSLHAKKYLLRLLIHPHEQKCTKSKKDEHQRGRSRTCSSVFFLRQYTCAMKNDARNILTSSATWLMFHIIISEIVGAHLSTVWRQGAGWRSSIRCVHPGGGAPGICMLMPSQSQLRAAAVRVRLHLPAWDQVGLQAWRDRNRERKSETERGRERRMSLSESDETRTEFGVVVSPWMKVLVAVFRFSRGSGCVLIWITLSGSGTKLASREWEAVNINISQLRKPRSYAWVILVSINIFTNMMCGALVHFVCFSSYLESDRWARVKGGSAKEKKQHDMKGWNPPLYRS